ncbi:MAG TPA: transposase, partial [Oscillatoriaceae cyanobacterium M33_DOE_052]|nr:transposase [Oscillatoriaceae cyanobacterium M33_DOE_052]
MTNQPPADYDSPWKEALDQYFEDFVEFFFPEAHSQINWERGYEFLDTELQQVVRDAELGRRLADKLVKVWRYDGTESLVLVHIEVQSQIEAGFAERMYVYNYRIFDRYRLPVATLVVLADEQPNWRPDHYGYEVFGCRMSLQFPIVKLLDYETEWESLQTNPNPFAVLVMAHLKSQATRRQPTERLQWKLSLAKSLYQRGYSRQDILELARLIDWMMTLPVELEQGFQVEMRNYEEGNKMPYVTSWERFGIEKESPQALSKGGEKLY